MIHVLPPLAAVFLIFGILFLVDTARLGILSRHRRAELRRRRAADYRTQHCLRDR